MSDNINEYAKPIIMRKRKFDIKAWIAYRKIIKKCKKLSPSFDQLWEIAEFIDIIRESYMYCNNTRFCLFLGSLPKGYTRLNAKSMFYKDRNDEFRICFILTTDSKTINIEIERKGQSLKPDKEVITFNDGEYTFKNVYDEEKFLFITAYLMDGVCELITYYFKNKKF